MSEYWGLKAIAQRLGVSKNTVLAWMDRYGFLMFRRRKGPRDYWYSNESLIQRWELARCDAEREARRLRKAARAAR